MDPINNARVNGLVQENPVHEVMRLAPQIKCKFTPAPGLLPSYSDTRPAIALILWKPESDPRVVFYLDRAFVSFHDKKSDTWKAAPSAKHNTVDLAMRDLLIRLETAAKIVEEDPSKDPLEVIMGWETRNAGSSIIGQQDF
ncbi:hypothetical protein MPH_04032 [Macrophomina phaseolina MS6]|uniref:Uncharacterized protein n=1 Tax=Macrophomina phaseolina (strain MS6) TaxID=1126212 RepID=K2R8F9_MACPH|nr:hypothetical protein MPH_04032 [Macrophomina phaseolina MS6]